MTGGHYIEVCEFGYTHGRCRCMGPHSTRRVTCDNIKHARNPKNVETYVPKHRKEGPAQ